MTNGILRPRTPQVFTDPQSEDKTAQGLESDSKSICHSKQMYFYPLVISNLQMGANEAQRSAKRHDLEHRLSLRILLRIHREKEYWEWLDFSNAQRILRQTPLTYTTHISL